MKLGRLFGARRRPSEFVEQFSAKDLPVLLDAMGRPPATKVELFPFGRHRSVYRLDLSDGSSLVLRLYPVRERKHSGVSHWYVNRHLAAMGFCVPTIHFRKVFPFPGGKTDVEVMIEDFVEGMSVEGAICQDPARRRQMAEILYRLHCDCSPRPGKPWMKGEAVELVSQMVSRAPLLLERLRAQLPEVTAQQARQCLTWIREAFARRPVPTSYELIYGGFDSRDLLFTPTGEIALIDTGSVSYDCFETDLVDARWGFLDQIWWEGFCTDYFALAPSRQARFERDAPLYFARFYLTTAASRAVRARKRAEKGNAETAEHSRAESRRFWNLLLATMEGSPLSGREFTR